VEKDGNAESAAKPQYGVQNKQEKSSQREAREEGMRNTAGEKVPSSASSKPPDKTLDVGDNRQGFRGKPSSFEFKKKKKKKKAASEGGETLHKKGKKK